MDKKPFPPELSQAEPLPTQEEQAQQVPASPPSRKRQIDSDDDDDAEPQTKRARTTQPTSKPSLLTRKNLALFNKMVQGKQNISDPTTDSGSKSTKTTATTTSGFARKAYKNGIREPIHSKLPTNLDDLRKRFAASRTTASPPESVYEDYLNRAEGAANEATVVMETGSRLLKEYEDKGYSRSFSRTFTNAPPNAGYNNGLSAPQPDFVEGLDQPEFDPFPVAEHIPGAALYKDDLRSTTLPHIAGEWKGPAGDMREARLQSAYDGAALVHARNQALAYMGESDPPGHAAITTFTTDGTALHLYAHFAAPPEEGQERPLYHQHLVSSMSLTSTHQGYKDARRSLRNAQDYAKAQSEELRDQLKEHWRQQRRGDLRPPVAEDVPSLPAPPGIEPLDACEAHEDGGYEIVQPPCPPTPEASTGPQKPAARSPSVSSSKPKSHASASSRSHSKGKRKAAPSSQSSHGSSVPVSKHRSYWKKDPATGGYYHRHTDGTVSWLDDEEENERD